MYSIPLDNFIFCNMYYTVAKLFSIVQLSYTKWITLDIVILHKYCFTISNNLK